MIQPVFFALVATFFAASACASEITPADLAKLPDADVYVLGEVHDNPVHHAHQAAAVAALAPRAIVFEMLTPENAANATDAARARRADLQAALAWDQLGWPDFAYYYPIFQAAPAARIFGGGVPRAQLRESVTQGAAAVLGDGAADFALDQPLPADMQDVREALQMEAHCNALPEHMLGGMVEAQRLRDAMLAQQVRAALDTVGAPVVVITGNGHARRDWGLPAVLSTARPDVAVLSVAQLEAAPDGPVPYDMWVVTAPAEREDPCAVFTKSD